MGQRQTDSGSVGFSGLLVAPDEILGPPGAQGSVRATLRPCVAQLVLVNLYVGIAEGAFAAARDYASTSVRPWLASGFTNAAEEPFSRALRRRSGCAVSGWKTKRWTSHSLQGASACV